MYFNKYSILYFKYVRICNLKCKYIPSLAFDMPKSGVLIKSIAIYRLIAEVVLVDRDVTLKRYHSSINADASMQNCINKMVEKLKKYK